MVVFQHIEAQRKCNCLGHYSDAEFNFPSISDERSINITTNASKISTQHTRSAAVGHTISTSTQFSRNIKNKGQQMLYQQQSLGMSPDPWGEVLFDCPTLEFSAISPQGPESPVSSVSSPLMPLATSIDYETSYTWCVDGEELMLPLSQKEETMCLANAHLHVSPPHTSPSDHSYSISSETRLKVHEDSCDEYDDGFSTADNRVLYRDTMISDASKVINFMDEDTNLETVKNYNEILIKKEMDPVDDDSLESAYVDEDEDQVTEAIEYTQADTKPNSQALKQLNEPVNRIGALSTVADDFKLWKPIEKVDFVKLEDRGEAVITVEEAEVYKLVEKNSLSISNTANQRGPMTKHSIKKENEEIMKNRKRHSRSELPKLSLGALPAKVKSVLEYEQQQQLNTPDIIEQTLNMEAENFDLINFICNQDLEAEPTFVATPLPSPKSPEVPESPVTDASSPPSVPASSTPKRKRLSVSLYENPSSVQSYQSSVDEPQPKKKRGRPPKTHSSLPSPSQLEGLTEQDLRYWEMRNKNNEASRRSRLHRKQKEQSMESEAECLVRHHKSLVATQKRLQQKVTLLETKLKEAIQ